jgi:hypothetical protein
LQYGQSHQNWRTNWCRHHTRLLQLQSCASILEHNLHHSGTSSTRRCDHTSSKLGIVGVQNCCCHDYPTFLQSYDRHDHQNLVSGHRGLISHVLCHHARAWQSLPMSQTHLQRDEPEIRKQASRRQVHSPKLVEDAPG